ncbi:MAG: sulfotransferase family 2 domain-containing protein, partial [Owenweeksia sp.]
MISVHNVFLSIFDQMATVFIHIPKTAGTTLTELLLKNYRSSEIEHIPEGGKKNAGELQKQSQEKACIFGHFRYHEELRTPDNFLFTFLRKPEDRFISNFFHLQREGSYTAKSLPEAMEEFLQEENLKKNGNWNTHTYFLAGTPGRKFFKNDEEHHVKLALQRLESLDFVGITENFEQSVYMLGQSLGWKKWYYLHQ